MTSTINFPKGRRLCTLLLVGTALGGIAVPAAAQPNTGQPASAQPVQPAPVPTIPLQPGVQPAVAPSVVRSISVAGNQRLEPETVVSYTSLRPGEAFDRDRIDQALRELYATELFADVQIDGLETGDILIQVRENPVINRIVLEGNRRLKDDKILPEIRLSPRQIFTRSRARADVARIIELYRRQGRFAARVEPQIVQLDQNRVDVVFEVEEGPRSSVRQINIIGNEAFSDSQLQSEMATREARGFPFNIIGGGNATYDPDRLAFDQQKLRLYYLTQGYADFRVVSAVAELTPDRRDFIITYVVEEGQRYRFGPVTVESDIRDFSSESLSAALPMRAGDFYNARQVEDTVTRLNELAGLYGYAFADVSPRFTRNRESLTMNVVFQVAEAQRTYVDRININGNTNTADKVIRREFRLAEGDPFNSIRVRRSRDRIQSLGYFQDALEIQQQELAPDRVALNVDVQERATGELQLSAGFSSVEQFLVNLSVQQRNFRGLGQQLRAAINYSSFSRSFELGFTEPYLFDRNIAIGADLFRRDYSSFNFLGGDRQTTYEEVATGGQVRVGVPLTENLQLALRYGLNFSEVGLNEEIYFTDPDGSGPLPSSCDPLLAGRYLCDIIGDRTVSSAGYTLVYSTLDNSIRPTRGFRALLSQDFAGIGGDTRYVRTRASAARYWSIGRGFILSASAEGGAIVPLQEEDRPGVDPIRLTDRFTLGSPQIRGFDIRGVGPRVQRRRFALNADGSPVLDSAGGFTFVEDENQITDDAIGGRYYYLAHLELEVPLGNSIRELGIRTSIFADIGALWNVRQPNLLNIEPGSAATLDQCRRADGSIFTVPRGTSCPTDTTLFRFGTSPFQETFLGDTPSPRISVGIGINWNSPFGPFRIDIAQALLSQEGDDTRLFTFNVGTAF